MDNQASRVIKSFLPRINVTISLSSQTITESTQPNAQLKRLKHTSSLHWPQLIATSHCNYGISSQHKLKPPSTCCIHPALIQACPVQSRPQTVRLELFPTDPTQVHSSYLQSPRIKRILGEPWHGCMVCWPIIGPLQIQPFLCT